VQGLPNVNRRPRRWAAAVVVLAFVLLSALFAPMSASARAVAVVYDDSGSMSKDQRWWHASYAIQALAGVLAEDDSLYIVYMGDPDKANRVEDRHRALLEFQDRQPSGQTPYGAVRTAMAALAATPDQDRWLVVITDGGFQDGETPLDLAPLPEEIRSFVQKSGTRTIFLLIGSGADAVVAEIWRQQVSASVLRAKDAAEIVDRMEDIGAMITSRAVGRSAVTSRISGSQAEITTAFPLKRLIVLQQARKPEALAPFKGAGEGDPRVRQSQDFQIRTPTLATRKAARFGRITHLVGSEADRVIPSGKLTIGFDHRLAADQVVFLPEVAARFDVRLVDGNGEALGPNKDGLFEPCLESPLSILGQLVDPDGKPLPVATSGLEVFWERSGDTTRHPMAADPSRQVFSDAVPFDEQVTVLSAGAFFPGYFDFKSRIFTVQGRDCKPHEYSLLLESLDSSGVPASSWSADVRDIGRAGHLRIGVTVDGVPMTAEELNGWSVTARAEDIDLDVGSSGEGWVVVPECRRWFASCCCPAGTLPVEIRVTNGNVAVSGTAAFVVEAGSWWSRCWQLLLAVTLLLVALIYAWGLSPWKKHRFARGSEVHYLQSGRQPMQRRCPLKGNLTSRWLIPFRPERAMVEDLWFLAGRRAGHIVLPPDQQRDHMSIAGQPIDPGKKDLKVMSGRGQQLDVQLDAATTRRYIYEAPSR
jgi:hypothetical protein